MTQLKRQNFESHTPPEITKLVRNVLGEQISLDPASGVHNSTGIKQTSSKCYYDIFYRGPNPKLFTKIFETVGNAEG